MANPSYGTLASFVQASGYLRGCQRAASSPSETLVPTLQKPDLDRLETLIYLAECLLSRSGCQKPTVGFRPTSDIPQRSFGWRFVAQVRPSEVN